ncbi:MAG TPA: Tm-1-like ATP-binding domain-containing protein [Acidobacteriota bacterium]|nr:Tm-1-like ATP-binding domain-containing protein [Acidobacteriota bacterium]
MTKTVAVLATLDTKGIEARYLAEQIETLGGAALLVDIGVVGEPAVEPDVSRAQVAAAGGTPLEEILEAPTRQAASPIMVAGATRLLLKRIADDRLDGVIGLGGTQGTSNCTGVMQGLPYGFPKVMVSTAASGDTSAFVGIKDITMMFSVGDILGLNPVTRKILANAAAAAYGMACSRVTLDIVPGAKPLIGMTNLGVLTEGAMLALQFFQEAGYEVIVFHAVGSGGLAMEQLMKDGLIGAVFDYGLGEIPDEMYDGLRASGPERLTVAGRLGLPQVICPGGLEHIGLLTEPNTVPERYREHQVAFHNPIILAIRLKAKELVAVAQEVTKRLSHTKDRAYFIMPKLGMSRYAVEGGQLHDPAGDEAFLAEIKRGLPDNIELLERELHAEDPAFVKEAVERLISLIEG